jgi:hypothetical protein
MADKMIVGRVVSLEGGKAVIEGFPTGPRIADPKIAALVEAARKYRMRPGDGKVIAALLEAAKAID